MVKKTYKIPEYIKVAGIKFYVENLPVDLAIAKKRYAEIRYLEGKILIDLSVGDQLHVLDCLLHEITHAIYRQYKIESADNEERTVTTMATAWVQIYVDNPDLIKFIASVTKGQE